MLPLAFLPLGHLLLVGLQRNKRRLLRFLHVDIERHGLRAILHIGIGRDVDRPENQRLQCVQCNIELGIIGLAGCLI